MGTNRPTDQRSTRLKKRRETGKKLGSRNGKQKERKKQGRIHGRQLQTGGQGRIYTFSHFSTRAYGPTNGRTDGRTDIASYRVARPQLEKKKEITFKMFFFSLTAISKS